MRRKRIKRNEIKRKVRNTERRTICKAKKAICLALCSAVLLAACSTPESTPAGSETVSLSAASSDNSVNAAATQGISEDRINFKDSDAYADWSDEEVTQIKLADGDTRVDGSGASWKDGVLTISEAGTYVLTGTISDGSVHIEAGKDDDIRLILNGVSIHCSDGSCIAVEEADKVILSLEDGSENTLEDSAEYADDEEFDSVIDAHADLVINGSGSLQVSALYNDGIKSHDDLRILGGTVSITAADDGLVAKDRLEIKDGTFDIDCEGDGLKATNEEDTTLGFVYIENGSFAIDSEGEAIQAKTDIQINGGQFDLTSGGGSENAAKRQDEFAMGPGSGDSGFRGGPGQGGQSGAFDPNDRNRNGNGESGDSSNAGTTSGIQTEDEENDTDTASSEAAGKTIKADGTITLNDGTFTINSADDAIHSNSAITINGGKYDISAGDDAVHADDTLTVSGGAVTIQKSYEGLESAEILIAGGAFDITSSDDGINAAGGELESGSSSMQRGPMMETSSGYLTISGGTITVNAGGDGLDANTSITQTGGDVMIYGPTDSFNGSLDYAESYEMSGGTLLAIGSSGMLQSISDSSKLNAVTVVGSGKEGDTVSVQDADGNELISVTAPETYQAVTYAAPSLKDGETYTVTMGDTQTEVTLSGTNTMVNSDGSTWSGGWMNWQ